VNNPITICALAIVTIYVLDFVVRWILYKRECKTFLAGSITESKHCLTGLTEYIDLPSTISASTALDKTEHILSELKMSYVRANQSICAFSWLFANYPFRLIVEVVDDSTLHLSFEDRHYKNYLLKSDLRRTEKRFKEMLNKLNKTILEPSV